MSRDLGTYHVRVELEDGRGWISAWPTGRRFCEGDADTKPLTARSIEPNWENEADLFHTMVYQHTKGNYSCDCNKALFLARAAQKDDPVDRPCGDTMPIRRLTVIRPDGSEIELDVPA